MKPKRRRTRPGSRSRLQAMDLFSGAGGLTLGLKHSGFDVVAAIELDPLACATYHANHPEVELYELDIRKLSGKRILRELGLEVGELDLLAGCPPCQGFSSMRTKNGGRRIVDQQNDLVFEFLRFVRALRPKAVMMENVPDLAKNRRTAHLKRELKRIGYSVECRVVDAADYGVPQRRRRMILIGTLGPLSEFPKGDFDRRTVAGAIRGLPKPGKSGDSLHDLPERRSPLVKELIRNIPKDGGSRADAPPKFTLECHKRTTGFTDVYGRMAWDEVAPTITGGCHNPSKGRFLHPSQNRTITLREAALLQTFPRRYRFSLDGGKERAALMIGNALPPRLIARVARPIRLHIERARR